MRTLTLFALMGAGAWYGHRAWTRHSMKRENGEMLAALTGMDSGEARSRAMAANATVKGGNVGIFNRFLRAMLAQSRPAMEAVRDEFMVTVWPVVLTRPEWAGIRERMIGT